jgi:hypothetical protein
MLFSHAANADPAYPEHCSPPAFAEDEQFGATLDGWALLADPNRMLMAFANPEYIDSEMLRLMREVRARCAVSTYPVRVVMVVPFGRGRANWNLFHSHGHTHPPPARPAPPSAQSSPSAPRAAAGPVRERVLFTVPAGHFKFWQPDFWRTGNTDVSGTPGAGFDVGVLLFENELAAREFPLTATGARLVKAWVRGNVRADVAARVLAGFDAALAGGQSPSGSPPPPPLSDAASPGMERFIARTGQRMRRELGWNESRRSLELAAAAGFLDEDTEDEVGALADGVAVREWTVKLWNRIEDYMAQHAGEQARRNEVGKLRGAAKKKTPSGAGRGGRGGRTGPSRGPTPSQGPPGGPASGLQGQPASATVLPGGGLLPPPLLLSLPT